jgi:hypothetical protein
MGANPKVWGPWPLYQRTNNSRGNSIIWPTKTRSIDDTLVQQTHFDAFGSLVRVLNPIKENSL